MNRVRGGKKSETRMTASVLKQHPNTQKVPKERSFNMTKYSRVELTWLKTKMLDLKTAEVRRQSGFGFQYNAFIYVAQTDTQ